ncbi:hypothetical protein [Escherichia coli]|uniref:hypothetical protein n=1 Tax=Escherichia coli TaxID=562 RepID=UPI000AE236A7|nr:hypothetical protein [Escherichia coli]
MQEVIFVRVHWRTLSNHFSMRLKRDDLTKLCMHYLNLIFLLKRGFSMTAIACWLNREEGESIWAVSDSRITQHESVMTNHCPKLFSIPVSVIRSNDIYRLSPEKIMEFGFGFAGGTMIGINVKELLAVSLSSLHEVNYYDVQQPELTYDSYPSLYEIAVLTKGIAEKFILDIGQFFPRSVATEMIIYGFCFRTQVHKIIKIYNTPSNPTNLVIEDCLDLTTGTPVVLGDRKQQFREDIEMTRGRFENGTLNWWRASFIALNNWISQDTVNTIGGHIQFSMANRIGTRNLFMSSSESNPLDMTYAGISNTSALGFTIGQLSIMPMLGMTLPGENGWPYGDQILHND